MELWNNICVSREVWAWRKSHGKKYSGSAVMTSGLEITCMGRNDMSLTHLWTFRSGARSVLNWSFWLQYNVVELPSDKWCCRRLSLFSVASQRQLMKIYIVLSLSIKLIKLHSGTAQKQGSSSGFLSCGVYDRSFISQPIIHCLYNCICLTNLSWLG